MSNEHWATHGIAMAAGPGPQRWGTREPQHACLSVCQRYGRRSDSLRLASCLLSAWPPSRHGNRASIWNFLRVVEVLCDNLQVTVGLYRPACLARDLIPLFISSNHLKIIWVTPIFTQTFILQIFSDFVAATKLLYSLNHCHNPWVNNVQLSYTGFNSRPQNYFKIVEHIWWMVPLSCCPPKSLHTAILHWKTGTERCKWTNKQQWHQCDDKTKEIILNVVFFADYFDGTNIKLSYRVQQVDIREGAQAAGWGEARSKYNRHEKRETKRKFLF